MPFPLFFSQPKMCPTGVEKTKRASRIERLKRGMEEPAEWKLESKLEIVPAPRPVQNDGKMEGDDQSRGNDVNSEFVKLF